MRSGIERILQDLWPLIHADYADFISVHPRRSAAETRLKFLDFPIFLDLNRLSGSRTVFVNSPNT